MDLRMPIGDEELKSAFSEFQLYADNSGIPLDDEADWGDWWECWMDGYSLAKLIQLKNKEPK